MPNHGGIRFETPQNLNPNPRNRPFTKNDGSFSKDNSGPAIATATRSPIVCIVCTSLGFRPLALDNYLRLGGIGPCKLLWPNTTLFPQKSPRGVCRHENLRPCAEILGRMMGCPSKKLCVFQVHHHRISLKHVGSHPELCATHLNLTPVSVFSEFGPFLLGGLWYPQSDNLNFAKTLFFCIQGSIMYSQVQGSIFHNLYWES